MNIRTLKSEDSETIKKIHAEHYSHEFELPDFSIGFYGSFAVINDKEEIITVGGLRPIIEEVIMTDKNYSVHERVKALEEVLKFSMALCNELKFNELHAFVHDSEWLSHLMRAGFSPTKGIATVLKV